jgi:hypothetical protein
MGSKVQRAEPFAAAVEAGNVLLVRGAWNDAFVDECRAFPAGAHDDQVDATADGFAWLGRRARAVHGTGGGGVIAVEALPGSGLHPGYGYPGYGHPGYGYPGYGHPGYGYPGYGYPGYGYPGCGIPYGDGLGYGERPVDDVGVVG